MAEFMKVTNHGKEQYKVEDFNDGIQFKPIELHYKEDGSIDNKPSFLMVMERHDRPKAFGQFTLKTLSDCLEELGYEIKKL